MKICVKEIVRNESERVCVSLCVCVRAHVGVIPASLSIHELRESSKGSWMTHITTGSARFGRSLGGISRHDHLQTVKPIYCIFSGFGFFLCMKPKVETHVEEM